MGETASIPAAGRRLVPSFLSERRLTQRAVAGEERAFEEIFERYHQELYRYCLSLLRDPDDAQDALQSTMSSALTSLPGETRKISLRAWLFRVAHNHAISLIRGRRGERTIESLPEVADPRAEERQAKREQLRQLLADLDELPERQRAALTMRELSGMPFEEIGAALSMSAAAARQAAYEARSSLLRFAEGRAMQCESARRTISDGDRRSLRSLSVAAHLRGCAGCREFRLQIERRERELSALCPPLPAVAAASVLERVLASAGEGPGVIGAGLAGAGGLGAAGKGAGAALALKSASALAVGALGVGVADYAGLVDVPALDRVLPSAEAERTPAAELAPPAAEPAAQPDTASLGVTPAAGLRSGTGDHPGRPSRGRGEPPAQSNAGGNGGRSSAHQPPAHSNASTAKGPPAHANPGGGAAGPPAHANPAGSAAGPPAHANSGAGRGSSAAQQPPAQSNAGAPQGYSGPAQANGGGSNPAGASAPPSSSGGRGPAGPHRDGAPGRGR